MPLFHCKDCHHEWEGSRNSDICDWCGAEDAEVLEEQTVLEKFMSDIFEFTKSLRNYSLGEDKKD